MTAIPARRFSLWGAHGDNPWVTASWATATLFLANLYAQLPAFADGDRMTTITILFLLFWFGQIVGNWLLAWTWCSAFALLSLIVGKRAADATFEFGVVLLVGLIATHFQSPLPDAFSEGAKQRAFYQAYSRVWAAVQAGAKRLRSRFSILIRKRIRRRR